MAHEALGKTQRLLASIVYSSQDAIVGQSLDGRITTWNPAAERIFGYSQDEAVGALASILLTDKQDSEALEILARVKQGLIVQDLRTERRHKDGNMIAVSLVTSPLRDESGQIIGLSIQAQNISKRKELEDKLSVVSEQLRTVLETTNEYVIALDHEWGVTYQNRLTNGEDSSSFVGKSLWKCSPYLIGTSFEQESRRAMSERKACRFEEYIPTLKSWLSGVAYPTEAGLLVLMRDDTEKQSLDDQLRSAQRMEAIGHLAAGVAHEINTPIQYIGDNTAFLRTAWDQVANVLSAAQSLRDEAANGQVSPATIRRSNPSGNWVDPA